MQQFQERLGVATSAHRKEIDMATKNQSERRILLFGDAGIFVYVSDTARR